MPDTPDPNTESGQRSTREYSEWASPNLKPVGYALAAAILICALPLAYRITNCASFESGFSLQKLFSFKCQAPPFPAPPPSDVSELARSAPVLTGKQGYVSYRVNNGVARETGDLSPPDGSDAPSFKEVKKGLVLTAIQKKQIRQRPFSQSIGRELTLGQCFQVIDGTRVEDEVSTGGRSGGWLPVALIACPDGKLSNNENAPQKHEEAGQSQASNLPPRIRPEEKVGSVEFATSRPTPPLLRAGWRRSYMIDGLQNSWGVIVGSYGTDEVNARQQLRQVCAAHPDIDAALVETINPSTKNENWTLFTAYGLSRGDASDLAKSGKVKSVKSDAYPSNLNFDPGSDLTAADRCELTGGGDKITQFQPTTFAKASGSIVGSTASGLGQIQTGAQLPPFQTRLDWDIGLATCAVNDHQAEALQSYIKNDLGFASARAIIQLDARQPWLAASNQVFYYRPEARSAAEGLAVALQQKFGVKFDLGMGAGLSVRTGFESHTLFVHVISSTC